MTTTKLDLAGLKCPLPALMTQRALKALQPGVLLENDCTDPLIQEAGGTIETNEGNRPPNSLIEKRMACLVAAAVSALRIRIDRSFCTATVPEAADIATFCLSTSG